jgi:hypothetical protein
MRRRCHADTDEISAGYARLKSAVNVSHRSRRPSRKCRSSAPPAGAVYARSRVSSRRGRCAAPRLDGDEDGATMSSTMAGWFSSPLRARSARAPRCARDTISRRFFDTIGAPFRRARRHHRPPRRERPRHRRVRRSKSGTGVAHALVSVNHDLSAPCRGGTERRPIPTDTRARERLCGERVVPKRAATTLLFE